MIVVVPGIVAQYLSLSESVGGALAILGGAFALGVRHGIDWDHIAAITDITSTSTTTVEEGEAALTREPGLLLTDESHHRLREDPPEVAKIAVTARAMEVRSGARSVALVPRVTTRFLQDRKQPLLLGTLYALGHATVVTLLGVIAIVAAGFLPGWIDPIMGRVVGVTLLFLAFYLYYSIYRFFRGGQFRIRSRWMLVFAGVRNAARWIAARLQGHKHHEVAHADQYGPRTAFGIGLIHGIGAETGTQVLIIATAVGAGSKFAGIAALFAFVCGLLVSNTIVTVATATGFVSASRRQGIYVGVGFVAATFSLIVGLLFLGAAEGLLPSLDQYFHWIGGPA